MGFKEDHQNKHFFKAVQLVVVAMLMVPVSAAELVDTKLENISLFKNGFGHFTWQIDPDGKREFSVILESSPSHGTFFVHYPVEAGLKQVTSKNIHIEKAQEALDVGELLRANVGKQVRIMTSPEPIQGTIEYFSEPQESSLNEPEVHFPRQSFGENRYKAIPHRSPQFVMVRTQEGQTAVMLNRIGHVEILGEANRTISEQVPAVRLDFNFIEPIDGPIFVRYLGRGAAWSPSYVVDISDPDKANLSAKTLIQNEIFDFDAAAVDLVTGFINLEYAEIESPLAQKQSMQQFFHSLSRLNDPRRSGQARIMTQSIVVRSASREHEFAPMHKAAEEGLQAEDMFFYPLGSVELAKGDVGYFHLFSADVEYEHVYTWDIPDYIQGQSIRHQSEEPDQQVWHCIRLKNEMDLPWTTAPAQMMKDGFLLGQDTLEYTSVGSETNLKITQAMDIQAQQGEIEIERERNALQLYGYHYDLVTIEGTLVVHNFKDEQIKLEITKTVTGEIAESNPEADIVSLARGLAQFNSMNQLSWKLTLKPQGLEELKYIYKVYVRR